MKKTRLGLGFVAVLHVGGRQLVDHLEGRRAADAEVADVIRPRAVDERHRHLARREVAGEVVADGRAAAQDGRRRRRPGRAGENGDAAAHGDLVAG